MNGIKEKSEGVASLQISQMTKEMVDIVSHVHIQAFKGSMNTRLGSSYLRKFFEWFVQFEAGIVLVAMLKTHDHEEIVGYIVGAPIDYGKAMNRDLFWVACWNTLIRPWLFLSDQFRETIKSRLVALFKQSSDQSFKVDLPLPVMSVVGVAVLPNCQGQSIGQELLSAFEAQARHLHIRSLRLSVYPDNLGARRVYEKCCWVPAPDSISPGGAMFYYKIL